MMDTSQYLYTAFLDVLAYRDLLKNDRDSGRLDFKDSLGESLRVFDDVNEAVFGVQAISDTVIVTCSTHTNFPDFLRILRKAFLAFLDQRLFIRGGIAYSQHFQSSRLTYSHAIARAYEIEQSLAVYPRIVVDNNLIEMYRSADDLPRIEGVGLLCCCNGVYFLNILESNSWKRAYQAAKAIYIRDARRLMRSEAAFAKHVWFEDYLVTSSHAPPTTERYIPKFGIL